MIRQLLAVVLSFVLTGCIAMEAAASLPSGDTKNWKTYRVEVGDQVVQFTIPPEESSDFPSFEIPQRIDLAQAGIFNQAQIGPKLLNRYWDYRTSRFAAVNGTLHAYILLWRSEGLLDSVDALRGAIEDNGKLLKMKELADGGRGGPPDAVRFETATVGGRTGLLEIHQITSPSYVVPVDPHHYLTISISVGVANPDWRADAQGAADAILKSIRIEPKH